MKENSLTSMMIAPCGMNCGTCLAYQRDKNTCAGCLSENSYKPTYCLHCIIKNCELLAQTSSGFCYECIKYPCKRLRQLDKRYRLKYHMSMIENLEAIKNHGLQAFMDLEKKRWRCIRCGETLCVHRNYCLNCKAAVIN